MFELLQGSKESWDWAYAHPYLFTVIKIGTPSVWAVILFAGSKIYKNALRGNRR